MGVYIPNMDKPKNITRCSYKINPEECKCIYTDKVFEETLALILDHPCDDCPIIDIVTCGECKYGILEDDDDIYRCGYNGSDWNEGNHFCSYGKRRSDEKYR